MASEQGSLLYTIFKVRQGEISRTALHFVYLLNVVGVIIIGRTVASALFLAEYDASRLPWMYVASAVSVSLVSWLYSRLTSKVRLDRLVVESTVLFAVVTVAARATMAMEIPFVYPVLYVLVEVMGSLLIIQFWSFANTLHNTREAKRLFGVIGAGGVLANIIVGFGAAALVQQIGTENLLWVMVACLALVVVSVVALGRRGQHQLIQSLTQQTTGRRKAGIAISQETARVFSSKHLRIIAAIVALTFIVTTLVDYQFKMVAKQSFDKTELTAFFSLLYGFTGVLSFLIQLFVTSRLLERFGILIGLALLPLSLTLGSMSLLLVPVAITAAVAKGADAVFRYTVNDATTQLLYLPVPAHSRLKAKAFIDGILKPVAYGSTGLVLAGSLALFPSLAERVHLLSIPAIALGLAWLGLVFGIRKEYVKSLLDTLRRRRLNLHDTRVRISDDSTIKVLVRSLEDGDVDEVENALQLLPYVEGYDWDPHVARLLAHDSERVRVLALEHLSKRGSLQFGNDVFQCFDDASERVRAAAITTYCAIGREKAIRAVRPFLGDESPAIRAAAMVGMIKYGGLDGVLAAAEALKQMLEHPEPALREHGARVLGAIRVRNFYQPILALLGDPDARVQLAAIASAGQMQSPELIPPLIYKLANKTTAPAAVAALGAYGAGIERTLSKVLGNEGEDSAVRRNIPRVLGRIGTQNAADILVRHLGTSDEALRQRVSHALNRIHHRQPELRVDVKAVQSAAEHEVQAGYEALRLLEDLRLDHAPMPNGGLLASALREKMDRAIERLFLLLGVIYPTKTMEVVFSSLQAELPTVRANAIEVLDNTLAKDLKRIVLPLVDETPRPEKLAVAREVYNLERRSADDALQTLLSDPNPWVVACAVRRVAELAAAGGDPGAGRQVLHHLRSQAAVVRETAAWVVSRHLPADEAAEALRPLAEDKSPTVKRMVAVTLAGIAGAPRIVSPAPDPG